MATAIFITPATPVYPDGAQLDPETGVPFDPTIESEGAADTRQEVEVGIYRQRVPSNMSDLATSTALGTIGNRRLILDVLTADYDRLALDEATEFEAYDERYKISDVDRKAIAENRHRVLVWGKRI